MSNYACTGCPSSCSIVVEEKDGDYIVSGNNCKMGADLAIEEYQNPKTGFTGMVRSEGLNSRYIYVAGSDQVPKDKVEDIKNELSKISVPLPVKRGDVIIKDVCGTGVDIIVTMGVS